ncbi:RloB family protein [Herbihabitans rhizosphaerae]|uniref:RloB family protein n=1 Tax=Herbihabitans rhizosphaerae TaxID=1872711 RepID=UPI00102D1619|nr:RloB family protein [Herbihabitans rhizosphaerae]
MTRRENRRGRRGPQLEERQQVLIVCGGEVTEPSYFRGLKKAARNPALRIDVRGRGEAPISLVQYTARVAENETYDRAWCVVDVDDFDLESVVALARDRGIGLAVSNPCFEYWLLLHFVACVRPMASFAHVVPQLRAHVPNYGKSRGEFRFEMYEPGIHAAISRAKARTPDHLNAWRLNPATGVWQLVEDLLNG